MADTYDAGKMLAEESDMALKQRQLARRKQFLIQQKEAVSRIQANLSSPRKKQKKRLWSRGAA